jgi:endo-1,4-beta-D-glucanase Y
MKKLTALFLSLLLIAGCVSSEPPPDEAGSNEYAAGQVPDGAPARPFPTDGGYVIPPMLPDNKTEAERHEMMINLLREILLNNLIVDSNGPQDRENFRMVLEHTGHDGNINVSESQGYGMMILAYMAGSEDALGLPEDEWRNGSVNLKDYFDAMLRTVIAFPSVSVPGTTLFAWKLLGDPQGEGSAKTAHFVRDPNGSSATDGDMDIIYALLLADKQWGSGTRFNGRSYMDIALNMLEDLWKYCVHDEYYTLRLGDWARFSPGRLRNATRPSDFILSHLKAYKEADPSHDWQKVLDATYEVISDIRGAENAGGRSNGLLPDFVVRGENRWEVPEGRILEANTDNAYGYNSVRVPWRLGTYYMLSGNTAILEDIISPIDIFAQEYSEGNPAEFSRARMDGSRIGTTDPGTFAAPFLVAAAANGQDQAWVNTFYDGWYEWLNIDGSWQERRAGMDTHRNNHYGDYIQLLALIAANGYWWAP